MKICPQCHTEYDDIKKFCRHDGVSLVSKIEESWTLEAGEAACPQCGMAIETGKRFCRHCGARLDINAKPLGEESRTAPSAPTPESLNPHTNDLALARKQYVQGEYQDAISRFERLLVQESDNRIYQLYWLLCHIKAYGIEGYENGIAEALQWKNLTQEENPLARELFILAGKESLKKGDLVGAEQRFLRARHIFPSQEVAKLLVMIEERKGNEAQQAGDFVQALTNYQRAATYDPDSQIHAQKLAQIVSLRVQERKRKRREVGRKVAWGGGLGLAVALLIVGGVLGYRKTREWLQTPTPQQEVSVKGNEELAPTPQTGVPFPSPVETSSDPQTTEEPQPKAEDVPLVAEPVKDQSRGLGEERPQIPVAEPERTAKATEPSKEASRQGTVVTVKELRLRVSGKGARDPNRSPEVLQQEVETHFPDLQEVYEAERTANPSLMGSLVLDLTIAPDGSTSHVRFKSAKIASKKLQDIVHGLAHEWRFSPASGKVRVDYPLLFLLPGMDAASIIAWERSTAALAPQPEPAPQAPAEHRQVAKPAPQEQKPQVPSGTYRVITSTPLQGEPHADASVVTQLQPGIRVRVVGAVGDYLEVRSRKGNAPGYVYKQDVVFLSSR